MKLTIQHHKTFTSEETPDEFNKLNKALRIWFKDFQGNLQNVNLLWRKEKSFPTGYLEVVLKKLEKRNVKPVIEDKRIFPAPYLMFSKKDNSTPLWDHQVVAMDAIAVNPTGIISSLMGTGKSRMLVETFLQKRVKTLVIVPTITIQKQLYKDFCDAIGMKNVSIKPPKDLSIPQAQRFGSSYNENLESSPEAGPKPKKLGSSYSEFSEQDGPPVAKKKLGGSYMDYLPKEIEPEEDYLKRKGDIAKYKKWQKKTLERKHLNIKPKKIKEFAVTILCFQSLDGIPRSFLESIHCVMVDECHHASARSVRDALLRLSNAAYRYGFSATPWRDKYNEEMLLISALGAKKIFDMSPEEAIEKKLVAKPKLQVIESPPPDKFMRDLRHWRTILENGIIANRKRNQVIVSRAKELIENGHNILICVDEIAHLEILKTRFEEKGITPTIIHGQMKHADKDANVKTVSFADTGIISIATMAVGEGANLVNVDVVILAGGGKGSVRFLQRIGRGIRKTAKKDEMYVIDFNDWFNPILAKHSRMRLKIYREIFGSYSSVL